MKADVEAMGLDSGSGHDLISNTGELKVLADSSSTLNNSSWTLAGAADDAGSLESTGEATGIFGAGGNDKIYNADTIDVDVTTSLNATGGSDAIFGKADSDAELSSSADVIGIDGGDNNDLIANLDTMNVDAKASMTSKSVSFSFIGSTASGANLTADATSTGIIGGSGIDEILNDGSLNVNSDASLSATGGAKSTISFGTDSESAATAEAESTAIGIDSGSHGDLVINRGTVEVSADADPSSINKITVGGLFAEGIANSKADGSTYATAVKLGGGENELSNRDKISVTTGGVIKAEADSNGGTWLGKVHAKSNTYATVDETHAIGIKAYNDFNLIANESAGKLTVTVGTKANASWSYANGQSGYAGHGTATGTAKVDESEAFGITVGGGTTRSVTPEQ